MAAMAEFVPREIYEAIGRLCAYYAYLEGTVSQAIWLELGVSHDFGHPITDRLQLRDSYKLLVDLQKWARREAAAAHLQNQRKRVEALMEARNLVVHGTVVFSAGRSEADTGIKWMMRRGSYNRRPQPVTLEFVEGLVNECQALAADLNKIGRFYLSTDGEGQMDENSIPEGH